MNFRVRQRLLGGAATAVAFEVANVEVACFPDAVGDIAAGHAAVALCVALFHRSVPFRASALF